MVGKDKEVEKVPVLKGTAAEKRVLEYVKEMNRPFGAADIFANLKGAVAKASVQKILVSLAEKGDITQKAYGKILIFVAKQADADEMPLTEFEALEVEEKRLTEGNKSNGSLLKTYTQELSQLRSSPSDAELETRLNEAEKTIQLFKGQLEPLRSGQPMITAEELAQLDVDWQKWRGEWVSRRKIFYSLYHLATDAMLPEERQDMEEMLGIEVDTVEHRELENSLFCKPPALSRR
ncbi:hypothetical protein M422DRAFT_224227 [Sphaerobolus stellatus SS14]|nr:hypothetical protein M422DRAFT_224227 [Sphaerobolus stellatus SS14]